ncbi:retrovirus-related pol polyprotein from transposon TNT 1-94 [Tanacetum coccineum]
MFCDNSATLLIANEPGVQMGARHYHRSNLLKVHTDNNLADPFTKDLSNRKLTQHARSMGLHPAKSFMDKEVNLARDSDDALVCCVENTVEDRIMDSGASFHATYCKEELERFKLRSSKTLDIAAVRDVILKTSSGTSWTLKDVRGLSKFIKKAMALHLLHQSEDPATMILLSKTATGVVNGIVMLKMVPETPLRFGVAERLSRTFRAESMGIRTEASKMLWADSVSMTYLIYAIPYVLIGLHILEEEWRGKDTSRTPEGSGLDEMRYSFWDTKSHQVIRSRDITFADSIYGARSATDSSSLTKPIQKSQVVLVDIPDNLAENDSIVAEHGLSSEITQSPGGSSDTSEGSENSGSFKDSGRSDEEYSEDGASSKEGGFETPQVRRSTRESRAPVRYSLSANYLLLTENGEPESYSEALSSKESVQWKKAIIEEMVSLEKNQTWSLVRISAGKKASQRLWIDQLGKICDNKCRVTFSEHDSEITKDGKVIGRGIRKKGLYVMKLGNKPKDQICLTTIDENSTLWHRRLGHANMRLIQSLASKELVRNLPKLKFDQHFCDACKIGKQAHASHKAKNVVSTTRCLKLLHMDLFGPSAVRSYGGNRYTLVIVDDYSRYTWTRFLKDKTEAFDQFEIFSRKIQNQLEPKNVNEALGDESWIVAMQEELNQFVANDVWELVPQPRNMTIIGTKWVFKNKLDENGIVSQNKARLVAQGYNQQEGIDYDETYAPVARLESIRILLAYACALDFKLFQMDVKSAFLNGFINEEVYVAQPPGFIDFEKPDHVYKLKKALYGLKQAPKAWYDRLKAFLIKHEYKIGMVDNTLFTKKKSSNLIIVQIYVDDIIFGSTCQDMCDEFTKIMHDEFEMSMMGELNFFLGLQIKQGNDGFFFNQSKYCLKKCAYEIWSRRGSKPMIPLTK